jgi:hypothetical protein
LTPPASSGGRKKGNAMSAAERKRRETEEEEKEEERSQNNEKSIVSAKLRSLAYVVNIIEKWGRRERGEEARDETNQRRTEQRGSNCQIGKRRI